MQVRKIFTGLLLSLAIGLPQYASAGRFCPTTDSGQIRIDQCLYSSQEDCENRSGAKKCVVDLPEPSDKAPYCLVIGWAEICDQYFDLESCERDAEKKAAQCVVSPYYKAPDQQQEGKK